MVCIIPIDERIMRNTDKNKKKGGFGEIMGPHNRYVESVIAEANGTASPSPIVCVKLKRKNSHPEIQKRAKYREL